MQYRRIIRLPVLVVLLAAAMLLRAGVPAGWMPVVDAHGSVSIAPCDGFGPVVPRLRQGEAMAHHAMGHGNHGAHHDGGEDRHQHRDPCPFGLALASAIDLPDAPLLAVQEALADPPGLPELVPARLVSRKSLRPPARGPPVIA